MIPTKSSLSIVCCVAITLSFGNHEKFDCNKTLLKKDMIFLHGGILDKYNNGRVFVSIQRVNNPKDWNDNEYFTGKGFSKDENKLLKVKDSCELKRRYFKVYNQ